MKRHLSHFAIAPCSFQMPEAANGNLVRIQVTPAGLFRPADGRQIDVPGWYIDASIAQRVIERFNARVQPLVLDYEHQTLNKEKNGQPAPAAGWFQSLEWEEGVGLFAIAELTDPALEHRKKKEYRFFSPVFEYNGTTGEVVELHMGAITNNPAIHGLQEMTLLAAATFGFHQPEDDSVNELLKALLAALGLPETTTEQAAITALTARLAEDPLTSVRKALALDEKADQGAVIAACTALQTKVASVDPAKFVPVDQVAAMQTQLAALTARLQERDDKEVTQLIDAALEDGRLAKALEPWARELGKSNVAALTSYLDSVTPIAALTSTQTKGKAPVVDNETGLTEAELAVCAATGISAEQFKAQKEA